MEELHDASPVSESVQDFDAERHATNLELFVDLVFVFAITQIASAVEHDVSWANVGKSVLLSYLVWWQWSQYTWAGAAVDLEHRVSTRVLVLATIPATLTMAVAIPGALHRTGRWFGVAYAVVQLLVLAMQGVLTFGVAATRAAFLRYALVAVPMPIAVAVGGFARNDVRTGVWVVAAALNVVSALAGASGEWGINPSYFSERHALFVIISLGEALVAIGTSATDHGLSTSVFGGLLASTSVVIVLWWMYFAFLPPVLERTLRTLDPAHRAVAARDLFSFGHFPVVAGIVGFAVVARHVVPTPADHLALPLRALLGGAVVAIQLGFTHLHWRVARQVSHAPLIVTPVIVALCLVASGMGGAAMVAVVGACLAIAQASTLRSLRSVTPFFAR